MNERKLFRKFLLGYPMAAALLIAFWILAVTAVPTKCCTCDEIVHLMAWYSYWKLNNYSVDPENGNLPQRLAALPLLLGDYRAPSVAEHPEWSQWVLGYEFFYKLGNDAQWMLLQGRMAMATMAVLLGLAVYYWSRRLFGPGGGVISTVLYAFSTAFLANGALATSDLAASLLLLCSVGCFWALLHKVTPLRLMGSCLAVGLLFVSKFSALVVLPMLALLALVRLLSSEPLPISFGKARHADDRWRQGLIFAGLLAAHIIAAWLVIWAFYGLRFEMAPPPATPEMSARCDWNKLSEIDYPLKSAIQACRDARLLPESYLYGQGYVLRWAEERPAFLNGNYSIHGWWYFFPYCLLVKTQLAFFAVLGLAAAAVVARWRSESKIEAESGGDCGSIRRRAAWRMFYRTAPLWVLLAVYWAMALASKINIGHRHILPTYAPAFILAGAAVHWFTSRRKAAMAMVSLCLVAYAAEAVLAWPDYLAYFNQVVGGPANGNKHLVDSSLDWGQDLPALRKWLDNRGLNGQAKPPVYLSYFGMGSPTYYGIHARRLRGYTDVDLEGGGYAPMMEGGVYCISATVLRTVPYAPTMGPWSAAYENTYRAVAKVLEGLKAGDPAAVEYVRSQGEGWARTQAYFEELRTARLCAYLRQRPWDDQVGYSILIYRLTDEEVRQAMFGPPVELVNDTVPMIKRLRSGK